MNAVAGYSALRCTLLEDNCSGPRTIHAKRWSLEPSWCGDRDQVAVTADPRNGGLRLDGRTECDHREGKSAADSANKQVKPGERLQGERRTGAVYQALDAGMNQSELSQERHEITIYLLAFC